MKLKLFIFAAVFLNAPLLWAQDLRVPQAIDLFQYSKSESGRPLNKNTNVRVWGWSNNGKVAYSTDTYQDGRGGHVVRFVVLNLVSDKPVFELRMDTEDHSGGIDCDGLYRLNREKITSALTEHNITLQEAKFLPFPLAKKTGAYKCCPERMVNYKATIGEIEYKKGDAERFVDKYVSKYSVTVSTDDVEKVVGKFTPENPTTGYVYLCGYFLSPFENRIMVVAAEEHWGFEGTDLRYRFAGCHLVSGFR